MPELRPYQQAAVEAVYKHLREKDTNPCVVMPTGTGKSVVIAKIASDAVNLWHGRVLILAHVKELLEQNADKVRKLCPELPIGIYSAGLQSRQTTEPVIVAGIQSVYNKACELGAFDLIIVDESHLIAPEGDGMYRTFLQDAKVINPNVRLIGMTATPYRLKGGPICKPENLLNEICYEVGLKEMIAQGYLSPIISRAGKTEAVLDNLHIRGGEFINDEVSAAMDQEELVKASCREIAELTRDRKSVIIFCTSVEHCRHVAAKISEYTGQECAIVTGDTPPCERAELIARFRGEKVPADLWGNLKPPLKYLCNVSVLTTGFDAPNVDCVVMLRPTNSPGLLVQIAGRGLRLSPETGKQNCIAEGTMILTDHGLIPIEKVTTQMKLWDGIEFVSHAGIIYKGEQDVIEYAGLCATPDHNVWSEHHWRTFGSCATEGKPISCTGTGRIEYRETDGYFRCGSCYEGIAYTEKTPFIDSETKVCSDTMPMWRNRLEKSGQSQTWNCRLPHMRQATQGTKMADRKDRERERKMRESQQSPLCGLRGTWNQVLLWRSNGNGPVADGAFQLFRQKNANRQDRQQRQLRTRQCQDDSSSHQRNEQKTSTQNQNAFVQTEIPGSAICRCDTLQSDFTRVQQRGDSQALQHPVVQAKRRVWDILNAGPRHRFTANGLLVSNCTFLDYGANIMRHGPLDMIKGKEPGSVGHGDAPVKKCPQCNALIHAGYTKCPECGYVFPPPERTNLTEHASTAGVLSGEVITTDYHVQRTFYAIHHKRNAEPGTPPTMRIDYEIGFNQDKSEWVCPGHTGYARQKFLKWWRNRAPEGCPIPANAGEAVALANAGYLTPVEGITVRYVTGEKFERITAYKFGVKASELPPEDWRVLFMPSKQELDPVVPDDDEELPF